MIPFRGGAVFDPPADFPYRMIASPIRCIGAAPYVPVTICVIRAGLHVENRRNIIFECLFHRHSPVSWWFRATRLPDDDPIISRYRNGVNPEYKIFWVFFQCRNPTVFPSTTGTQSDKPLCYLSKIVQRVPVTDCSYCCYCPSM